MKEKQTGAVKKVMENAVPDDAMEGSAGPSLGLPHVPLRQEPSPPMHPWLRRMHVVLTIGGGFIGVAVTLQALFTMKDTRSVLYGILATFIGLYGYGIFAGLRLAERLETKHLILFYWLQVPWISSPLVGYRFAAGFHVSGILGQSNGIFLRLGSDWQFNFLQPLPWGLGVNLFALVMVWLLVRKPKKPSAKPEPTLGKSLAERFDEWRNLQSVRPEAGSSPQNEKPAAPDAAPRA